MYRLKKSHNVDKSYEDYKLEEICPICNNKLSTDFYIERKTTWAVRKAFCKICDKIINQVRYKPMELVK